jgi:hypothetical protein
MVFATTRQQQLSMEINSYNVLEDFCYFSISIYLCPYQKRKFKLNCIYVLFG